MAPLRDYLKHGIPLAFGLDSLSMNDDEDMFQDLRLGQVVQNRPGLDSEPIPAATMFGMATHGGAAVTGIEGAGSLEVGKRADAALVSLAEFSGGHAAQPLADLMLRRAKAVHVKTVIIGGKAVVQDGRWSGQEPAMLREQLSAALGPPAERVGPRPVVQVKQVVRDVLRSYDRNEA
jgi:5-methylthioadenosine/S-adenosylhomocysteine deaminase